MATCTRSVWKVLSGCQKHLRCGGHIQTSFTQRNLPVRTFAFVKGKKKDEAQKEEKKERRVIDDKDRHKPYGKTAWVPVDDVYVRKFYPRTINDAADAIDLLKRYQALDFTPEIQQVYIDLKLDMKLEKKKRVDPFVSTVHLPHPFTMEMKRVLVFTEDANQVKQAMDGGAVFAGGVELIQPILDEEIAADFYVAVPDILQKLTPLKSKLRKKFPKSKRGSVSINIPKMLELFTTGHQYQVEDECYVRTQIATLDMNREHIYDNLKFLLIDICKHKPADKGPLIERAIIASHTSEALLFRSEDLLPKPVEKD